MKITGWILVVLGALSFLGAALKGNGTIGPLFWLALGSYLLYRVNKKSKEIENLAPSSTAKTEIDMMSSNQDGVPVLSENLDDIQSNLTTRQKEAAMCLIAFFSGFNDTLIGHDILLIYRKALMFFGFSESPEILSQIMSKYDDTDTLVDIVLTINHTKSKDFILLTCYELTKFSKQREPLEILINIANDMGYDRHQFYNLIKNIPNAIYIESYLNIPTDD
jgi:hypothetical protein bacD2_24371